MIGLCRRRLSERTPETGNRHPRLAAEHPLRAEIDGGVWIKLEDESFRVLARARRRTEFERTGETRGSLRFVRRFGQHGEGAKQFHRRTKGYRLRALVRTDQFLFFG